MNNPLDCFVVFLYFAIILYIGKKASDRVKRENDYFLASKKMGKIPTALSLAAADFGGSGLVGAMGLAYLKGMSGGWWDFIAVPSYITLGFILVPVIKKMNFHSVPQYLGKRYSLETRIIAAVLHLSCFTVSISAQMIVASMVISSLTGIPMLYTVLVATAVFVLYTARGGLTAVIWTDVWSYLVLMMSVIISVPFLLVRAGGVGHIVSVVPSSFWHMGSIGWLEPLAWTVMGYYMYSTNQCHLQRIIAAKDVAIARFAYLFVGVNYLFYGVLIAILGICVAVISPGLGDPKMVITIVGKVLPQGFRGLLMAGILAATMSTSSSLLNACAAIFTIDIYRSLINPCANEVTSLRVARASTYVIVVLSFLISYKMNNLIEIIVLGQIIYSSCVFFPFILGLKFAFINTRGAFWAIVGGVMGAIYSNFFLYQKVSGFLGYLHPVFVSSAVSLFLLVFVSLISRNFEKNMQ